MQLEMDRLLAAGQFDLQKFKQEQEIKDQQADAERNKMLKFDHFYGLLLPRPRERGFGLYFAILERKRIYSCCF